jgi:hypothetical protein
MTGPGLAIIIPAYNQEALDREDCEPVANLLSIVLGTVQ